jgi:endonuclease/exonuclease/phosphatase family metal-dependent hydrolase
MFIFRVLICLLFICQFLVAGYAEAGALRSSIRVCSLNLHNFGKKEEVAAKGKGKSKKKSANKQKEQLKFLVERVQKAKCDIVALQEVYGKSAKEARKNLKKFQTAVNSATNQEYVYHYAKTNDKFIRNGYIYKKKLGKVTWKHLYRSPVPRLNDDAPSRRFPRGPLVMSIELSKQYFTKARKLYLIDYHFKSKLSGWKDLSEFDFEVNRIETAEAVRKIAEEQDKQANTVVLFMGDRNSDTDSATDEVLSGKLELVDFKGMCSIDKKYLSAHCAGYQKRAAKFIGMLAKRKGNDVAHSYKYRDKEFLYDEIYISAKFAQLVKKVGIVGVYGLGSDHLLVWAEVKL